MNVESLIAEWPGRCTVVLGRVGAERQLVHVGDLTRPYAWASVTKLAVSLAAARLFDDGGARADQPLGPAGSTVAHLLSHASGLGLEAGDRTVAPGTRRIYSNVGIDVVSDELSGGDVGAWLARLVFQPLTMTTSTLEGRAASGGAGSVGDLVRLAEAWAQPTLFSLATRERMITPFLPELDGIVPGFGRFSPCPWGMGPELRANKHHWMGGWPSTSFGHFGQSGAFVLVEPASGLYSCAAGDAPFGAWARDLWPRLTSALYDVAESQ